MSTDWVCLFDKRLSDEILSLATADLADFLQPRLHELASFSEFICGFAEEIPAPVRLSQLRQQGRTEEQLKCDVVQSLCISSDPLYLDYWGCYAEVFIGDPPGSIPESELFPHLKEQRYLLLRSDHVDLMLASLESHRAEVVVMSDANVSLLRNWRDQCGQDTGKMVAYFFSY
ncbi:MAG: hypothetical protein ABSF28_26530 [Terracidiphilus sp.]|jgi:hypothetical protein